MFEKIKLLGIVLAWITSNCLQTHHSAFNPPATRYLTSGFSSWISHGLWLSIPSDPRTISPSKLQNLIHKSSHIDPDELFFWINGASILSYDLEEKSKPKISIALLDRALIRHPNNSFLNYEKGKIYLLKLKNPSQARTCFSQASNAILPTLDSSLLRESPVDCAQQL